MRRSRNLSEETKLKISNSLRGRTLSEVTKSRISESMRKYWTGIPFAPNNNGDEGKKEIKPQISNSQLPPMEHDTEPCS